MENQRNRTLSINRSREENRIQHSTVSNKPSQQEHPFPVIPSAAAVAFQVVQGAASKPVKASGTAGVRSNVRPGNRCEWLLDAETGVGGPGG